MPVFAAGIVRSALAPSFTMLPAGRVVTSFSHAAFLAWAPVLPKQQPSSVGLRDELRVVSRKPVPLAVATNAVGFAGVTVVFTCIALLLTRIAGFSRAAVSALLLAYGADSSLGDPAAGELTDRSMSATVRGVFGGWTGVRVAMPIAAACQPTAVLAVLGPDMLATTVIAPLQGLILRDAGSAPPLAVAADVGAFNLGAAADSALGGPSSPPGLCAGPAWPGRYSASAAWP
jgi:DHA1 family inner membrane transport protein